jgi:3-oxoacyl-[acyl-carrier-protein] synthase III
MAPPDVYIRSVGTELPGLPIDNATLAARFGMSSAWEQWIDAFVGTRQRHFAVDLDTGEVRYTLTDLGTTAARRALAAAGLTSADVDLMVMATASPQMLMPTTVNLIADKIGANDIPAFQLQSGCTGAVQALHVASRLLWSGGYKTALVIGGDSCAKHLDITVDVTKMTPEEQINGVLFGDGAGAVVLSTTPGPGSVALRHTHVQIVGLNRPPGQVVEYYGQADRFTERKTVVEDYKAIENSVPTMAAEALTEVIEALDWKEDDVDYLLPPQLSGVMTAKISKELGLADATEVSCVVETGNTGNALPFFQLERVLPRMITGDRAVAVSIESSKWIKAGFAVEGV